MAATAKTSETPGAPMPDFHLPDVATGTLHDRSFFHGASGALIVFLCRHCPYVVHMREELVRIAGEYVDRGILTLAISSNDAVAYPDDAPEKLREMHLPFPLLYDESQDVARRFDAVCTPDLYLYDAGLGLFYRGRLDESTPGNGKPVTGADLRAALDALLAGSTPPPHPQPSMGCSIKWK